MKERINYLLYQYYNNLSNKEEFDELLNIIESSKFDLEISETIKDLYLELKIKDPSLTYIDDDGKLKDISSAENQNITKLSSRKKQSNKKHLYWLAASIAAILLLIFNFYNTETAKLKEEVLVIKKVASDENKVLTLSDGTKIWVNASSRLEYPQEFTKGQPRQVNLTGEAYFEVEHASDWPFIVNTGDVQTKVLGTKFNIKAYPEMEQIFVTVKSGKVKVERKNKTLATLTENKELRIPTIEPKIDNQIKAKSLVNKTAGNWISGYLDYEDEEIKSIITDLERHFNTKIRIEKQILNNKIITFSIDRNSTIAETLDVLTLLTNTKFKMINNEYIIF